MALAIPSSARGIDMERARAPLPQRPGRAILRGLLDLRPSVRTERTAVAVEEAVSRGLAVAKVYAFASADYPGAAQSLLFDNDGTTAVGAFVVDPSSGTTPTTAFTFKNGAYEISSCRARLQASPRASTPQV